MDDSIKVRIKNVMGAVFDIPVYQIKDNSSADTIESWDSLKHINLVVSLEEEFQVEFTEDEILEMLNFMLIKEIISSK
jgi:acyl carrier protein